MFELTNVRIRLLLSSEAIKKLEDNNLMVVDKKDFETTMTKYNEMKAESKAMKTQIKALEVKIQQMQQSKFVQEA